MIFNFYKLIDKKSRNVLRLLGCLIIVRFLGEAHAV